MMNEKRTLSCWSCLGLLLLSQASLGAADAVDVTIEADATTLAVGESTTVTVYGQVAATIEADSNQIFSWYVDVLNDDGGVAGGYANVVTPASDNTPSTSSDGTPDGAHLRGIYDTFLNNPDAGKGNAVILVQFDIIARTAGTSTFSVVAGSTGLPLDDFLVDSSGGSLAGGNYTSASLVITVSGEVDLSALDLTVKVIGTQANLTFNPVAGYDHTVQFSDTLLPASWTDLPGGPHNLGALSDDITGNPERFYRILLTAQ